MAGFDSARLREWITSAIEVAYPPRCSGCGLRGRWVCEECLDSTPLFAEPRCPVCSLPLGRAPCDCRALPAEVDTLWVAGPFDGWLRSAIHSYKFSGETVRAAHFAELMAPGFADLASDIALAPVPLHPRRKRQRGYDQTLILAKAISKHTGHPVFTGLKKSRDTPHQVGLDRGERSANLRDAFEIASGMNMPAHLVLIDDVSTTGATLTECAIALRRAGAIIVSAAVIAHGL